MHPHASLLSLSCDQPHSTCVGYSEVCKESIQMYRKHFPTHPNLGDVTKISWNQQKQGTIDLLVGGSPCQNLTTANNLGSNNGLQGKKSGLFFHYCRLFREMGCRYFILENVSRMKKESLHEITKQLQTLTPLKVNKYVQLYLFPNSFTLFNTVKYCQILSNTVKYCQTTYCVYNTRCNVDTFSELLFQVLVEQRGLFRPAPPPLLLDQCSVTHTDSRTKDGSTHVGTNSSGKTFTPKVYILGTVQMPIAG
jgi:hypothetical protein